MRTAPVAMHGLSNVPGPVEPFGRSARFASGAAEAEAVAGGGSAVLAAEAEAEGAGAVSASFFEHESRHSERVTIAVEFLTPATLPHHASETEHGYAWRSNRCLPQASAP